MPEIKSSEKFKRICTRYYPVGGFTEAAKLDLYDFCHRYAWEQIEAAMNKIEPSEANEKLCEFIKRGQPLSYYREKLEANIQRGVNQSEIKRQRSFAPSIADIMHSASSGKEKD